MKSNSPKKATVAVGLAGLASVRDTLRQKQAQALEEAARLRQAQAAAERQRRVFVDTVGPVTAVVLIWLFPGIVTALPAHGRNLATPSPPEPLPLQREKDEQAALQEAMSDEVDVESLLLTDDGLSFHRSGVGPDVVLRLRRGHWAIQGELDLHGMRRDEARDQLAEFLREAARRGWRCLRVVHGKGHGSPGREPVLKAKVHRWLGQKAQVLAFTQASAPMGGAGALIVLLRGGSAG